MRINLPAWTLAVILIGGLVGFVIRDVSARMPLRSVRNTAEVHLEECAKPYVGALRLERIRHITWKVMPESLTAEYRGLTLLPDTVLLAPEWQNDPWTVAHEMLHVAIGYPGHPYFPFGVCGLQQEVGP